MRLLQTTLLFGLLLAALGQLGLLWLRERLAAACGRRRPTELVAARRRLTDA